LPAFGPPLATWTLVRVELELNGRLRLRPNGVQLASKPASLKALQQFQIERSPQRCSLDRPFERKVSPLTHSASNSRSLRPAESPGCAPLCFQRVSSQSSSSSLIDCGRRPAAQSGRLIKRWAAHRLADDGSALAGSSRDTMAARWNERRLTNLAAGRPEAPSAKFARLELRPKWPAFACPANSVRRQDGGGVGPIFWQFAFGGQLAAAR